VKEMRGERRRRTQKEEESHKLRGGKPTKKTGKISNGI
jgi:hypothetical protein